MLSGQKPIITKAKKAISNFKLREGQPIGIKVTLRGVSMYDFIGSFLQHSFAHAFATFEAFLPKAMDVATIHLGIDDQQIFPEINLDEVKRDSRDEYYVCHDSANR